MASLLVITFFEAGCGDRGLPIRLKYSRCGNLMFKPLSNPSKSLSLFLFRLMEQNDRTHFITDISWDDELGVT